MNPNHALLPEWMFRWVNRDASAPSSSQLSTRLEVYPPQLWPSSLGWRNRLQRWLRRLTPWTASPALPVNRLTAVKDDFLVALNDLDGAAVDALADRIARARSLRELWHLRAPVYGALATALNQSEAERRMAGLNQHFPTRTPRPSSLSAH